MPTTDRRTAVWCYPWDLLDEGIGPALETMRRRADVTDVHVAVTYHAGKFLHVHNPRRRVVFPVSGTLYFVPSSRWHGKLRITPPVWEPAREAFWERLGSEAEERDVSLTAWTLCLHCSGIGLAHPDVSIENAHGDRVYTDLCPNQPDVREYLVEMVADVAENLPVDRILLESLEFMPFRHGYHHEVVGVPTGPTVDFLMSLCFCPACHRAGADHGLDLAGVRRWVRARLDRHFENPYDGVPRLSWPELHDAADGAFGAFLRVRQSSLTSLLREIVERVRDVSRASIALLDFGPLYPNGPDGRAWENGVDLAQQLPLVDEIHPTFYFTDLETHRAKVHEYVALLGGEKPMIPAIRAIAPQTDSADALAAQVQPLLGRCAGVSFYNYGFMALPALDWIATAMRMEASAA